MSGRRTANNRIRGPQSALTDYLASHNISAAQIANDYERRQREAQQAAEAEASANGEEVEEEPQEVRIETAAQKKKRKRQEEEALAKIKQKKGKKPKKKKDGSDDDDDDVGFDMYAKKKPLPGQLEHCELCDKRFTVTPYSKTGPDGGLLCVKCSKEKETQRKKDAKPKKQTVARDKRRQVQSNLLEGIVQEGSKSLSQLCIEKLADNIHDVDEFGDLPKPLLNRLSQILSRKRVLTSRTLGLFLNSGNDTIDVYDCGKLETEDYIKIFSIMHKAQNVNLRNAGQFKDEVIDYLIERSIPLRNLQLEGANLVSNAFWNKFFTHCGSGLSSLKLSWLDYSMDDETLTHLATHCPNLNRLKLKKCFRLTDDALIALQSLPSLEHLSLRFPTITSPEPLRDLIASIGTNLRTLSLEAFVEADDSVLETIHSTCTTLQKLRLCENEVCTDAGFAALFTNWNNPSLKFIDLSSNRSIDYTQPDGPEEAIGLASAGFEALMIHSGSKLETLDISSCRHISYDAFSLVFNGKNIYPSLSDINISFLTKIDTAIVAGIFKSCPGIKKVTAFGCFNVLGVMVPRRVALVGLPNAQDSIVQEGVYEFEMDVDEPDMYGEAKL